MHRILASDSRKSLQSLQPFIPCIVRAVHSGFCEEVDERSACLTTDNFAFLSISHCISNDRVQPGQKFACRVLASVTLLHHIVHRSTLTARPVCLSCPSVYPTRQAGRLCLRGRPCVIRMRTRSPLWGPCCPPGTSCPAASARWPVKR